MNAAGRPPGEHASLTGISRCSGSFSYPPGGQVGKCPRKHRQHAVRHGAAGTRDRLSVVVPTGV